MSISDFFEFFYFNTWHNYEVTRDTTMKWHV